MPNKTIYVSDGDLVLFSRAQELSGANLSATITAALKRFVEAEEGRREGYEEFTVKVGPGTGRKVRFTGVLLGEWDGSRVFRGRKGKFAVHADHSDRTLELYESADELCEHIPEEVHDLIAAALQQPPVEVLDI